MPTFPRTRPDYGSYRWFQSQLGRMLKNPKPNPDTWDVAEREELHDIINRGAQRVYFPDDVGDGMNHSWSFLKVRFSVPVTDSVEEYVLPDDFGSIIGSLYFDGSDSAYAAVTKTTPDQILALRSGYNANVSGYPLQYAEEWTDSDGSSPQRMRLLFWATPGASYTLNGTYAVNPRDLTAEHPYPYGGRPMVPALLASMQAILEPKREQAYRVALVAAMQWDAGRDTGQYMGTMNTGDWPPSTNSKIQRFKETEVGVTYTPS